MDLQIEGRHTGVTAEWRSDIEARVADLHPGKEMTHLRVTLTKHDHRKADDSFDVVIVAHIPGHTITARKQQNSFEEAIRDTFAALKVELDKIRQKRSSHEIRATVPHKRGIVKKVIREEGYGFILLDDGTEVYFHRHAVQDLDFEQMDEGLQVALSVASGEKGLQATVVTPLPVVAELFGDKTSTM